MTADLAASKWIEGLYHDTPCVVAARMVLESRVEAVGRMMALAASPPDNDPEYVHQLRVSSRRADAAMRLFRPCLRDGVYRRGRTALRSVRKAASLARNDDVHLEMLQKESSRMPSDAAHGVDIARDFFLRSRKRAQEKLEVEGRQFHRMELGRRLHEGIVLPSRPGETAIHTTAHGDPNFPYTLGGLSHLVLPQLFDQFVAAAKRDLAEVESLHQLRIAGKSLRYSLEVLTCCLPRDESASLYRELVKVQSRLGRINDDAEISARLFHEADRLQKRGVKKAGSNGADPSCRAAALAAVGAYFHAQFERNCRRFSHWFDAIRQRKIFEAVSTLGGPLHPHGPVRELSGRPPGDSLSPLRLRDTVVRPMRSRRVAAIDVGTNSIRMAIAETDPAVGFRIIEDVKETTRLGSGVFASGKLKVGAVKRSLTALERMRKVAENYHVDSLQAVATSAIREAANGSDFVKLIRRRVGIPIEVIQPHREARLAFAGVARDFDLADHRVAVVDTGGGSTEVIFATDGVIDAIRPVPLGAVRLTEGFGDPAEPGQYRFQEMRKRIEKVLRKSIRRLPYRPDFIVGAGGTFTSLARVALREGETDKGGRFPFAVRGCELRHKAVSRVLGELRRMSLAERSRIPGLSVKRAEIIVAGLSIVERLMEHLGVNQLYIHDGGIRDGLVAELIDELGFRCQPPRTHPEQVIGAVARYAERMKFPREHSEHVAKLSLRILDSLVEAQGEAVGNWGKPAHRDLLRCAALLHDVGHAISKKAHHKHAYDMILHADLSTLTRRETEIIANICRYHRGRGPHRRDPGFRKLGAEDQRLVAQLAGILRIADGLDYSWEQKVTDVRVRIEDDGTVFEISGNGDWAAERERARDKADVFESAFHTRVKCKRQPAVRSMQSA